MNRGNESIVNKVKLIINADDYGISIPVNSAIDYCLKNQIINSASLMVNAPFFHDAFQRIKGSDYEDLIGIHINLTEFKPVTDFAFREFLDFEGRWNKDFVYRFRLPGNRTLDAALRKELQAQVDIFLATGLKPAHINSHHHCHTFPWALPLFRELAEKMQVPLRIALTSPTGNRVKNIYRSFSNWNTKRKGLAYSDYFEDKYTFQKKAHQIKEGIVEIMTHPIFNDRNELVDTLDLLPLQQNLPVLDQQPTSTKTN